MGESSLFEISSHVEKHIGKINTVLHEDKSYLVHIDILIVEPTEKDPTYKLITSGMSDKPMILPEGFEHDSNKFAELIITLPKDWQINNMNDENWFWPIRLIKTLAMFPHQFDTFLDVGHTISNEDNTKFCNTTNMCGSIIVETTNYNNEFSEMITTKGKKIKFLTVIPLYQEEIEYKIKNSQEELLKTIESNHDLFILNNNRKIVIK